MKPFLFVPVRGTFSVQVEGETWVYDAQGKLLGKSRPFQGGVVTQGPTLSLRAGEARVVPLAPKAR